MTYFSYLYIIALIHLYVEFLLLRYNYVKHAFFTRHIGSPNFSDSWTVIPSVLSNYIKTILKQLGKLFGPDPINERGQAGDRPRRFVRNGEKAGNSRAHLSQKSIAYVRTSRWWRRNDVKVNYMRSRDRAR